MTPLLSIVEGWTGTLGPFTLRVDDAPCSLVGCAVEAVIRDSPGASVEAGGVVTIHDQRRFPGQISYTPAATDFVHGGARYHTIRFRVTGADGRVVFFPNADAAAIAVMRR